MESSLGVTRRKYRFYFRIPRLWIPGQPYLGPLCPTCPTRASGDNLTRSGDFTDALNSESDLTFETRHLCDTTSNSVSKLHILRVGTDGSSSDVIAYQWSYSAHGVYTVPAPYNPNDPNSPLPIYTSEGTQTGSLPIRRLSERDLDHECGPRSDA